MIDFYRSVQLLLILGKTGQIAHVLSPSSDIAHNSRVTLLRRLVGSGWGTGAKTLRIAALSLVYSTASTVHQSGVQSPQCLEQRLADSLWMPASHAPTDHLPILSGIQPAELH